MPKRARTEKPVSSIDEPLIPLSKNNIHDRVVALGNQIRADYGQRPLTIVSVLTGAAFFTVDLIKRLEDIPLQLQFVRVTSYENRQSSGILELGMLSERGIRDEEVLIVDDILDSGKTLHTLVAIVMALGAKSVKTCALLQKLKERKWRVDLDYCGFSIGDEFVIGYGLDGPEGLYRNLSCITVLCDE